MAAKKQNQPKEDFNPDFNMKDLAISELRSLWRHFNQQAQPVHTNKDGQAFERTQSQIDFAVNMREKVQRLAGIVNSL